MEPKQIKNLLATLGFTSQEGAKGVFRKEYSQFRNYAITVDCDKKSINYGDKIKCGSKRTQNFSQAENFVVLECVDRLLTKGYKPENIFLEKGYPAGRGVTKSLDILVSLDGKPYLMIECKTHGEEFDKELKKIQKNGGQLFTYFQQDTKAELLMLYASQLGNNGIISDFRIAKIEEAFRNAGSVKQVHALWDGRFHETGFWENHPYGFKNEIFTKSQLEELTEDKGRKLFHGFATILRKHSVSDKPNAFNVIFNLFLAKLFDEQKRDEDELEFQWKNNDDPVEFQVRLYNLHKEGLFDFLKKEIEGIDEKDFGAQTKDEQYKAKKKFLKFNKLFDIKSVMDDDDFEQNHRVLKEVVQLIEKYRIRYPRKQKYLSEFFELLLTTGLKQEAGQYFTPPTITKFIARSLPLPELLKQHINQKSPSLPAAIDYAAGSGHFITEILEEYQDIIENLDTSDFYPQAKKTVASWKADQYNWAAQYVYGIEKDYRLVKVAKVGCYFYGDGLAQVVLGDGLDSFEKSKSYIGLLKENAKKPQFSILVSNPPYSVEGVKDDLEYIGAQDEFTLFNNLTDKSSEIEALFVERTDQLLKEKGIAGIVLPNSILSNGGMHAKAREIILQNFDVVAITQLGGNTFMATNTNTVVLFLRKRNVSEVKRIKDLAYHIAENYPKTHEDLTVNGIEEPIKKYLDYTGETEINPEKFYYYVLNYHQKTVIVKTGDKEDEKRFLGYEISKRRGSEGYHAIQGDKTIDECTKLYSDKDYEDTTKANAYIYKAFNGEFPGIHETLNNNVFCVDFVDMLTFSRDNFDKSISLAVKKNVKVKSKWDCVKLNKLVDIVRGGSPRPINQYLTSDPNGVNWIKIGDVRPDSKYIYGTSEKIIPDGAKKSRFVNPGDFILSNSMSYGRPYIMKTNGCIHDGWLLMSNFNEKLNKDYFYYILASEIAQQQFVMAASDGTSVDNLNIDRVSSIQIPLPPPDIQAKIVKEIEKIEQEEKSIRDRTERLKQKIASDFNSIQAPSSTVRLDTYFHVNKTTLNPITEWQDGDFTYVDIDSVGKGDGTINWSQSIPCKDAPSRARRVAENHTVVISTVRPYLKGFCYIEQAPERTIFSTGFALLNSKSEQQFLSKFLYYLFMYSSRLGKQMEDKMPKVAYPSINTEDMKNFLLPLLPLSEQKKIVAKIEKLENEISDLQKELETFTERKNAVLQKWL
ncbi:MAG: N-6 DNA methylase [Planctomycetaceae bacterium]|nr:N-6 DNA methylase [Planctomycetaceae bacterium]